MKRSRNDQIMSGVLHYLKRRQYTTDSDVTTSEKPEKHNMVCDIKELVMACAVHNNDSTETTVSYSCVSGDPILYDQQYTKIKIFVLDSLEPYRTELSPILYPLFSHVYLELISNGQKASALKFFMRHQSLFSDVDDHKPLLAALATLSSREDLLNNKLVTEFIEKRYHVSLSEGAFLYLLKYLRHEDHLLILQIISQHLDVSVRTDESSDKDTHVAGDGGALLCPPRTPSAIHTPVTCGAGDIKVKDAALGALKRVIQRVEQGIPSLPSICLYSLHNTSQGCSCATLSNDDSFVCAGFEDSRLIMWPLTPQRQVSRPGSTVRCQGIERDDVVMRVSQIHSAADHPDDIRQKLSSATSAIDASLSHDAAVDIISDGSDEAKVLRAHSSTVYATCFMHDHQLLLSASADKTVRLWDVATSANAVCYNGHNYPVFGVDSCDVGSMFASCSYDQTAKLWCTDRIYPLRTFIGHTQGVNCVKFHPNCNYIATGSTDMTVRLWCLQDGQPSRLLQGHIGMVMSLAFSPNGKYLASAGEDGRVKVWDLGSSNLLMDLRGHTDVIYSLVFNADSTLLASGGLDSTIKLWDIRHAATTESNASAGNRTSSSTANSQQLLASYETKSSGAVLGLKFSKRNFLQAVTS